MTAGTNYTEGTIDSSVNSLSEGTDGIGIKNEDYNDDGRRRDSSDSIVDPDLDADDEMYEDEENEDTYSGIEDRGHNLSAPSTVLPKATDFVEMAKRLMKPVPDYPVSSEAYNVWEISNWNDLKEEKVRGPRFVCGDFEWNILLFPHGNNNKLSIYVEPHPIEKEIDGVRVAPDKWYVCAKFGLDFWNPDSPDSHYSSGSYHRFSNQETDWGFSSFIDLRSLKSPMKNQGKPILENQKLNITAYIRIIDDSSTGVLWSSFLDYDSKKATGYVGLSNQGATCYLNSLLQSYFTTKCFRKLVYQIPVSVDKTSVPLSLQKLFYSLSKSDEAIGTLELTRSFGWDSSDAFTQHDVQELNRILMDKLETAMKGTPIEGGLNDIFVGKMKSFIKCVNVPYESSRIEDFWDIQLNVRGFKNLQESFKNYVEIEMLEGENKYQAGDGFGYQDAKKGVVFQSFPPVLHLQLKRFEYDFMVDDLVKIDDHYEFPDSIDLKPFLEEDLPSEITNQNWTYKLHGVLVHQGSISNGHYYAMIKTKANDETWLRFDDDKVWKVTPYQVFHENYGADDIRPEEFARLSRVDQNEHLMRRATSAYMLVYYRESELSKILPDSDDEINAAIPKVIPEQIKHEKEEFERIEQAKQESLYYSNVKLVGYENFSAFDGFDLYPDTTIPRYYDENLYPKDSFPLIKKYKKDGEFIDVILDVGKSLNYLDDNNPDLSSNAEALSELPFRLITINHRNNHTNRPDTCLDANTICSSTVGGLYIKCFNKKHDELCFYVEEINKDLRNLTVTLPEGNNNDPKQFSHEEVKERILKAASELDLKSLKLLNREEGSPFVIIFLKYFDPFSQKVMGLTHCTVKKNEMVSSLVESLNKLLGFTPDTELKFFEELSPFKVDPVDKSLTFEKSELRDGDILCVQVHSNSDVLSSCEYKNPVDFYNFLFTRLHIHVSSFKTETEDEDSDYVLKDLETPSKYNALRNKSFDLWVSTQDSYHDLARKIANQIDTSLDPKYLRLFVVNYQGVRFPLKSVHSLSQFFPKSVAISQVTNFEYEILNISIREYENMKSVKISWLKNIMHFQVYDLLVSKHGTVGDLILKLIQKVNISEQERSGILIWAGIEHKYFELIKFDRSLESLSDKYQLYAGYFPVEVDILEKYDMIKNFRSDPIVLENLENEETRAELELARANIKSLNIIPAFHFHKNSNSQHGVPFIFPVYPEETFDKTRERLRKRLGLGSQAFDKIRFALADSNGKGRYLDGDIEKIVLYDEIGGFEDSVSLGLDHPDRAPKKVSQYDKGISIK